MTYTPVTCVKAGEVHLRVCLKAPFAEQHVYLPQHGWNAGQVKLTGSDPINHTIAGYINYINDGTNESLKSDLGTPDQAQWGGHFTGAKYMAVALNGGNYSVGVIPHLAADADNLSAASMTITNVGNAGTTPPASFTINDGPTDPHLAGPSPLGGNRISWFEGRSTTIHFLTSDGTALTREQAFPMDGGDQFRDFAVGRTASWVFDGTNIWHPSYRQSSANKVLLTRFVPTAVGDPYNYEKFEVTFDDATLDALVLASGGPFYSSCTANSFFLQATDYTQFGNIKWLEIAKDGTSYTEYFITGNAAVTAFATHNVPFVAKTPGGKVRVTGTAYTGDGYAVGTYDLTCTGINNNQGHVHAKKRTLGPPRTVTGNLIPSGDMQDGSDRFLTSGDMQGGTDGLLWQEKY